MMGNTHKAAAVALSLAVAAASGLDAPHAAAAAIGGVVGAWLPDRDRIVNPGPNHRSLPHSVLFGGVFAIVLGLFVVPLLALRLPSLGFGGGPSLASLVGPAGWGFTLGYLSHLLLDSLTASGVWLTVPGKRRLRLAKVKVGGGVDNLMFLGCIVIALVLAVATWGTGLP